MEQDRPDKVREQAEGWAEVAAKVEEWVEVQAVAEAPAQVREPEAAWGVEAVLQQDREDTAFVQNAEKRQFIRRELPAIIRFVPNAEQL